MKKVTQHLFTVLVAVLSLSKPGSFVTVTFEEDGAKLNVEADKGLMPPNVLQSMMHGWVAKVQEYCRLNPEMDMSKLFLNLTRNDDGTFTADSSFTGQYNLDAYENAEEAFKASLLDGIQLEADFEHELAAAEA